jgi:putative DNA primase/helicase
MNKKEKITALAKHFVENENVIYFEKHFYLYNEGIWRLESDENTKSWIATCYIRKYGDAPAIKEIKEIIEYISVFTYDLYRKKIKYLSENHIENTINTKSGILNLDTLEVKPYTKDDFCFYKLPFDYKEKVECKEMMKFLTSSMNYDIKANDFDINDYKKTMHFIQEWMGYSLVAGNVYEKALLMIGKGANGKSVLQDIWEYIIGEYNCSYVDLKYINDGSQIFMTRNKLANFCKDLENNLQLDTGITKAAVSGQKVVSNEKYKGQINMDFTAKIIIACNELPYIQNASVSVKRRFHVLPFYKVFSEKEQDKDLINKLKKEAEDIFSWAVKGYRNLKKRGKFEVPNRCEYSMDNYLKNNDSVQTWIDENELIKENSRAKKTDLKKDYIAWCKESGLRPLGVYKLYARLEDKGFTKKVIQGVHYFEGLKLPNQIDF